MNEYDPSEDVVDLIALFQKYEVQIQNKILRVRTLPAERVTARLIRARMKEVRSLLAELKEGADLWASRSVLGVYDRGVDVAIVQLRKKMKTEVLATGGSIHKELVDIFVDEISSRFEDVTNTIARSVSDKFRKIQLEATISTAFGTGTLAEAQKVIKNDLLKQGITGFVDKSGRRWNMETYAEMASRTVLMKAHTKAIETEFTSHGEDLVKVSEHPMSCPKCDPYQGAVLSITGKTGGYATVEEARNDGLFHPRCRHAISLYVPT